MKNEKVIDITSELDQCTNVFGKIKEEIRIRIQAFMENPTTDTWDDISTIIIDGWKTVWQYVIEIDPTFPRSGRQTRSDSEEIVKDWERIPTPKDVYKALFFATH